MIHFFSKAGLGGPGWAAGQPVWRSGVCAILLGVCLLVRPSAAETNAVPAEESRGLVEERIDALRNAALAGRWQTGIGPGKLTLTFNRNGTYTLDDTAGSYRVASNRVTLVEGGQEATYTFDFKDQTLILSGKNLAGPVTYNRAPDFTPQLDSLLSVSPKKLKARLLNIGQIALIVIICRVFLWMVQALSLWLVNSEWGPLKYMYRSRKNRAMTIHSLVLNLVKYIVYFTAVGFILTELGINYRVYIASLSVVGLAVGFGSQGLVQDVVTGLGLVIENQFDVGDMVEISGQTGIVEGLGLRMTRLRNYQGQVVIIPNRNIMVVGRYSEKALYCTVDISRPAAAEPEALLLLVDEAAKSLKEQFNDVVLAVSKAEGPLQGSAKEKIIRLRLSIWPQQQWVIDQQLVPRLREQIKQKQWEIPGDRIAVYYAAPEPRNAFRARGLSLGPEAGHGNKTG